MTSRHRWAKNNVQYNDAEIVDSSKWNYITCYVSVGVLVHSFLLHGRKYDRVRACTDVACILGIIPAISSAFEARYPDLFTKVIVEDIINFVICGLLIKICDVEMFFSRYCVIQRMSPRQRNRHYFTCFFVYAVLISTVTIAPTFVNISSPRYSVVYVYTLAAAVCIMMFYILYFTVMSVRVIWSLTRWERYQRPSLNPPPAIPNTAFQGVETPSSGAGISSDLSRVEKQKLVGSSLQRRLWPTRGCRVEVSILHEDPIINNLPEDGGQMDGYTANQVAVVVASPNARSGGGHNKNITQQPDDAAGIHSAVWRWRLKVVAYKSIIHAVISIAGLMMTVIAGVTLSRTVGLQTIITLHVLFNYRIEDVVCPSKSKVKNRAKGRQSRELSAIWQLRKGGNLVRRIAESVLNGGSAATSAAAGGVAGGKGADVAAASGVATAGVLIKAIATRRGVEVMSPGGSSPAVAAPPAAVFGMPRRTDRGGRGGSSVRRPATLPAAATAVNKPQGGKR